ncbi:YdcF family protein [Mucilaginibacter glaciei]|uniref:YdcF family protein n=1 Tax=Mucilaginibacter glaciei TaxID=2772109 RepID=A0A926NT22_9SPHI|nr:YdcF family protein [Mucilaginibacter glaciei]MBD1393450.1 YdcF family protein [Mucilaginibacter glaciei]
MYFIVSKILVIFIYPFTWVLALLLVAVFCKNQRKKQRLLITGIALLYFFGNTVPIKLFARTWDIGSYPPAGKKYSSVILLGGFVSEGDDGKGIFNQSADRYIQATKLLAGHNTSHLLFTGGNGDITPSKFREGDFVKADLLKMHFTDTAILIDNQARNTIENALNARKLLTQAKLKPPYLLVTSAFHMRRSLLIFEKAGLKVAPYPSDFLIKGPLEFADLLPNAGAFGLWSRYIKEMVGYTAAYFKKI